MPKPADGLDERAVVILRSAADTGDPEEALYSLIDVLNDLYEALLMPEEVSPAAVRHYLLDYYFAQVSNGGHSQFLANTAGPGQRELFAHIGAALEELGRADATDVWADFLDTLGAVPQEQLLTFLDGGYLDADGFHPLPRLAPLDDRFFAISDELSVANGRLLLSRDELVVLDDDDLPGYVAARQAAIPDLEHRRAAAWAAEPSYVKAARHYAAEHHLEFEGVTAGRPVHEPGLDLIEWFFLAGGRAFSLIERPDGSVEVRAQGGPDRFAG